MQPQHSDVLVVSCDLVSSVQVHLLMEFHACCQSTLTCLLAESATTQEEPAVRKYNSAVGKLHCVYVLRHRDTNTYIYNCRT